MAAGTIYLDEIADKVICDVIKKIFKETGELLSKKQLVPLIFKDNSNEIYEIVMRNRFHNLEKAIERSEQEKKQRDKEIEQGLRIGHQELINDTKKMFMEMR